MSYGNTPTIHYRNYKIDSSLFSSSEKSMVDSANKILSSKLSYESESNESYNLINISDYNPNMYYTSNRYISHSYFGNSDGTISSCIN